MSSAGRRVYGGSKKLCSRKEMKCKTAVFSQFPLLSSSGMTVKSIGKGRRRTIGRNGVRKQIGIDA